MSNRAKNELPHTLGNASPTELAIRLVLAGGLFWLAFDIVRPFLVIIIWSAVLTVALYPVFNWFSQRLGGMRLLASILTVSVTLAIVIGPLTWLSLNLADGVRSLNTFLSTCNYSVPPPPEFIKVWPVAGKPLFEFWALASTNLQSALGYLLPELRSTGEVMLGFASRAGAGALQFLAAIIVAGFLFSPSLRIVEVLKQAARRIDAVRGDAFVEIGGSTIRSVSRGVVGVSILQALVGGVSMSLAAVPFADMLTFALLVFGIIQLGPVLIVIGVIIWAWMTMTFWPALALTAAMSSLYAMESLLKPFAMAHGLNTPMLVIFIGVVGGILANGVLGLFTGPILLSLAWELLKAFVQAGKARRVA